MNDFKASPLPPSSSGDKSNLKWCCTVSPRVWHATPETSIMVRPSRTALVVHVQEGSDKCIVSKLLDIFPALGPTSVAMSFLPYNRQF